VSFELILMFAMFVVFMVCATALARLYGPERAKEIIELVRDVALDVSNILKEAAGIVHELSRELKEAREKKKGEE